MVSCIFRVGSGLTKAKKQNNQKKRFIARHLIFLLAILLKTLKKRKLTVIKLFGPLWTNRTTFDHFGPKSPKLTILDQLDHFGPLLTHFNHFGPLGPLYKPLNNVNQL